MPEEASDGPGDSVMALNDSALRMVRGMLAILVDVHSAAVVHGAVFTADREVQKQATNQ